MTHEDDELEYENSLEYKEHLVFLALQDMDEHRKKKEEIFRRIDEHFAKLPSVGEMLRIMREGTEEEKEMIRRLGEP